MTRAGTATPTVAFGVGTTAETFTAVAGDEASVRPYSQRSGGLRPDGGRARSQSAPTALGVVFRDGVVLAGTTGRVRGATVTGTDRPIVQIHPTAAVTLTASLGDARAFADRLREIADRYELEHDAPIGLEALATRAGSLRRDDDGSGRLLLGGVDDEPRLYVLEADGGLLAEAAFTAVGSGSQLVVGTLEDRYDDPDRADATELARSALESAVSRDTGSVGPATLATVTADGVSMNDVDR